MMSATAMTTSSRTLLCNDFTVPRLYNPKPWSFIHDQSLLRRNDFAYSSSIGSSCSRHFLYIDYMTSGRRGRTTTAGVGSDRSTQDGGDNVRKLLQLVLWVMEGVYILWLFLLPYAPGDPVWAISSDTVGSLVGLSLNFFFILPLMNTVGIHVMNAPVLHPVSEGLFNFVIGWTLMFAPLLFSDFRRDRYRGSLDVLWGFQMFLTNVFLIPYMAIRLNEADDSVYPQTKPSWLGTVMIKGSPVVGFIGGAICLISILWAIIGRMDGGDFGNVKERWEFLVTYLGTERLAYAFIWDIVLYAVFQPWLIIDNLRNVEKSKVGTLKYLGFVPVVGLVAYLLFLDREGVR